MATRVAGASALDNAGILVPTEEPSRLATAVDALLADPARRRQLGQAARRRAVERYPVQRSALRSGYGRSSVCQVQLSTKPRFGLGRDGANCIRMEGS